ncbi:MAG: adenosylcobinamide-phosphate synthase CbiB [Clostridia bacterium]|nr:adenosylcobinamide-phosphate synthase CbiB [Clostridia bacterium]
MSFFEMNIAAMLAGFLLDLIIGDPEGWTHPVIWIGKWISFMEKRLRRKGGNLRRSALVLTASTVLLSMAATAAVLGILVLVHKAALFAGMCIISWWCLSAKCLAVEAKGVYRALGVTMEKGRTQVARIVGRDTTELSEEEIVCATVETIAENTTDGVISPMLYLVIGGPVLAMGFKAASTLDSMVGYLNEKYRDIGWSSAKFDDVLNYIPARICGWLMCIGAFFVKLDGKNAIRIMRRDHANHLSPNCAWSESAAAGAMHIQLGGTHTYFGKVVEKPTIGDDDRSVEKRDILLANRLLYVSSAMMAEIAALAGVMIWLI